MMSVDPLIGSAFAEGVSVIDEPVGARSGTFWQATVRAAADTSNRASAGAR